MRKHRGHLKRLKLRDKNNEDGLRGAFGREQSNPRKPKKFLNGNW